MGIPPLWISLEAFWDESSCLISDITEELALVGYYRYKAALDAHQGQLIVSPKLRASEPSGLGGMVWDGTGSGQTRLD